jgi:hypothetical protein
MVVTDILASCKARLALELGTRHILHNDDSYSQIASEVKSALFALK